MADAHGVDALVAESARDASSITVVVLTFNEQLHIRRCLEHARPVAHRLIVVDSFSTDGTLEIARALGAEVFQRPFKHQADQFQWALDNTGIKTEWVLRLDADEYLEPALIEEIKTRPGEATAEITGYYLKRKVFFRNKWIRFGGYYSTWILRLWRFDAGSIEQRWMDERAFLSYGRAERMNCGDLVDENLRDIGWWTDKHNRYATRQMVDFISREYPELFETDRRLEAVKDDHAKWKRFLRNYVFGKSPLYFRSVLYFLQRYFFRFGFLDGREGFVWHFLQGFWFFVLMDAKIDEARSYIRQHGIDAFRMHLRDEYGIEGGQ